MNAEETAVDWSGWRDLLDQHQRFLLTTHVRPDGDALGSELALAELLEAHGKQVQILNADLVPPRLAFLDPHQRISALPAAVADPPAVDVIVVVDTSAWGQLGRMADVIRRADTPCVIVDHHAGPAEVPGMLFHDPQAEAAGRLIADLAAFLDVTLTASMAQSLYVAIATDTGWFRFPSTRGSTHRVVARLIEAGACPSEIYRQLYERDSWNRTQLRTRALSRLALVCHGRLAHTYLLNRDFSETGADRSDAEDFINMGLALDGTRVAIMLTEQAAGTVKLSLRSRTDAVDCNHVAGLFGGGGHRAAAGATVAGELAEVWQRVLEALQPLLAGEDPPSGPAPA